MDGLLNVILTEFAVGLAFADAYTAFAVIVIDSLPNRSGVKAAGSHLTSVPEGSLTPPSNVLVGFATGVVWSSDLTIDAVASMCAAFTLIVLVDDALNGLLFESVAFTTTDAGASSEFDVTDGFMFVRCAF